jgi:ADP-ribose pyrophosphatase YjhB (NUDIX family)
VAGISFNILNLILAGNLPLFVSVRIIVKEQGRYLVIEDRKGHFSLPGGFTRWNEDPAQAAIRECEEETGLRVKLGDAVSQRAMVSKRFDRMSLFTITYQATIISGELRGSLEGKPCWKSEAELRGRMVPGGMNILEDYLEHRAHPGNSMLPNT